VTAGKYGIHDANAGTAGLVVRDGPGNRYILTCAHVLAAYGASADLDKVFAPHFKHCGDCECNSPFGTIVGSPVKGASVPIAGQTYALDVGLVALFPDADWTNEVPDIGMLQSTLDIIPLLGAASFSNGAALVDTSNQPLAFPVRKYGHKTQHTRGIIRRLRAVGAPGGPDADEGAPGFTGWLFEVDAVLGPGEAPPTNEYELDVARMTAASMATPATIAGRLNNGVLTATLAGSTLTVTGPTFSRVGDSGSAIVDTGGNVLGIVQGGLYERIYVVDEDELVTFSIGRTWGVFIEPARLSLFPPAGVTFQPGASSRGARVVVPGMGVERAPFDLAAMTRAGDAFDALAAGSRFAKLARHHFPEIRRLVHHRRRVTVAWHRAKGPGFMAAVLRGSLEPGWPIPETIDGVTLRAVLGVMRDVLVMEGSPELRQAVDELGPHVLALADGLGSVSELVERLDAMEHA
jgi:hypothetical protein